MSTFERDGVRFAYPENWELQADETDEGGWTATVQSPGTAFLVVSLRPEALDPADLADQTLDALKAEYQDLEAENVVETVAGRVAVGHDLDFLTLDTAITCRTRCLDTPAGPLLVMAQVSGLDAPANDPVLRAIGASLAVDEE
ncbi:MAG: hypothetical protein K2P78_15085 [Gemmataceae bacterium]|nr:hypothetical protein [Gemmataceae bacterium]